MQREAPTITSNESALRRTSAADRTRVPARRPRHADSDPAPMW
jgi:hypothetical protein